MSIGGGGQVDDPPPCHPYVVKNLQDAAFHILEVPLFS